MATTFIVEYLRDERSVYAVPHERQVYVESYGCAANRFDLQVILGYLKGMGFKIAERPSDADLLLVNTCGVKKQTEDKIIFSLRKLGETGKPLIIAGCLPKINSQAIESAAPNFAAMMDPYSIDKMALAVQGALMGERRRAYFSDRPPRKPALPKWSDNGLIEIAAIQEGCLGKCTFCATKIARPSLFSYPKELIVEQVREAVAQGAMEVWLTGQDTGAYGRDLRYRLTDLLREILTVPGDYRLRLGMMNPQLIQDLRQDLLEIYRTDKIYKFLHIPVQSGSDAVLDDMNRPYRAHDFTRLVQEFRNSFNGMTIATDVIVGFPSETEADFMETIHMLEETQPDVVNVSRYTPRPGTESATMNPLLLKVVNERSRRLTRICAEITLARNLKMVGATSRAFISERNEKGKYVGRTENYKHVFTDEELQGGERITLEITGATSRYLEGRRVS